MIIVSLLINNKNVTSDLNSIIKTLCVNYKNGTKLLGPKSKQIQKWVKQLSKKFANDTSQIQVKFRTMIVMVKKIISPLWIFWKDQLRSVVGKP